MATETAKAAAHKAVHDLHVQIAGMDGPCHCNLVAEVVLKAITDADWHIVRLVEPAPGRTDKTWYSGRQVVIGDEHTSELRSERDGSHNGN